MKLFIFFQLNIFLIPACKNTQERILSFLNHVKEMPQILLSLYMEAVAILFIQETYALLLQNYTSI